MHLKFGATLWLLLLGSMVPAQANVSAQYMDSPVGQLRPVPVPDLIQVESDVRLALQKAREHLDLLIVGDADPLELSESYGNTGLLYHAHLILEPAAACYRNAALLSPKDYRWPYYLGYLQHQAGRLEQAAEAYRIALQLKPDSAVARLRLGRIYLELGRLEQAESLLRKAARQPGLEGAALFELGKLAFARRDFAAARDALLDALQVDPNASRIHYTLALAYRGLGELEPARRHLALRGDRDPDLVDPLVDLMAELPTGQRMLYHSGMNAAHREEYRLAARFFQDGIALEPDNLNARVSLARFLYLSGESDAAEAHLEQVLERAPEQVLANLLLALLLESRGEGEAAMVRFRRGMDSDPSHPGVHYFMAGALMRRGEYAASVRHYEEVLRQTLENAGAGYWHIIASIKAGVSHAELRESLEVAYSRYPEDPAIGYFFSALLAASPDDTVRDGTRALAIAEALYRRHASLEHGELLAMAYAENGQFEQAVSIQNQVMTSASAMFRFDLVRRMNANLERYLAGQPCRNPWAEADLVYLTPPIGVRTAFKAYPPEATF
jgi:tetratricopeptide (TPR) repeat protein